MAILEIIFEEIGCGRREKKGATYEKESESLAVVVGLGNRTFALDGFCPGEQPGKAEF